MSTDEQGCTCEGGIECRAHGVRFGIDASEHGPVFDVGGPLLRVTTTSPPPRTGEGRYLPDGRVQYRADGGEWKDCAAL